MAKSKAISKNNSGVDFDGYFCYVLQQYLLYAPEEILKKFYNGYKFSDPRWREKNDECIFLGMKFTEEGVEAMNVYIWDSEYNPRYLEVSEQYQYLLQDFNAYHSCLILHRALKTACKESYLTENNIIPHLKNNNESSIEEVLKHRNRHLKFCNNTWQESREIWNEFLRKQIDKVLIDFSFLKSQINENPSNLYFGYIPHEQ